MFAHTAKIKLQSYIKVGIHMHVCVCVYGISKSKDKLGGYPYIWMRVRLRMIFKYTDIVWRKTYDVYSNAYMDS